MTDRYNQFVVVLDKDLRTDDAEPLMNAIRQMKGVLSVEGNVVTSSDHAAAVRVKHELSQKVFDFIQSM
jgi:tripartite-type tricarboxylate transporter receptor subunit TctC